MNVKYGITRQNNSGNNFIFNSTFVTTLNTTITINETSYSGNSFCVFILNDIELTLLTNKSLYIYVGFKNNIVYKSNKLSFLLNNNNKSQFENIDGIINETVQFTDTIVNSQISLSLLNPLQVKINAVATFPALNWGNNMTNYPIYTNNFKRIDNCGNITIIEDHNGNSEFDIMLNTNDSNDLYYNHRYTYQIDFRIKDTFFDNMYGSISIQKQGQIVTPFKLPNITNIKLIQNLYYRVLFTHDASNSFIGEGAVNTSVQLNIILQNNFNNTKQITIQNIQIQSPYDVFTYYIVKEEIIDNKFLVYSPLPISNDTTYYIFWNQSSVKLSDYVDNINQVLDIKNVSMRSLSEDETFNGEIVYNLGKEDVISGIYQNFIEVQITTLVRDTYEFILIYESNTYIGAFDTSSNNIEINAGIVSFFFNKKSGGIISDNGTKLTYTFVGFGDKNNNCMNSLASNPFEVIEGTGPTPNNFTIISIEENLNSFKITASGDQYTDKLILIPLQISNTITGVNLRGVEDRYTYGADELGGVGQKYITIDICDNIIDETYISIVKNNIRNNFNTITQNIYALTKSVNNEKKSVFTFPDDLGSIQFDTYSNHSLFNKNKLYSGFHYHFMIIGVNKNNNFDLINTVARYVYNCKLLNPAENILNITNSVNKESIVFNISASLGSLDNKLLYDYVIYFENYIQHPIKQENGAIMNNTSTSITVRDLIPGGTYNIDVSLSTIMRLDNSSVYQLEDLSTNSSNLSVTTQTYINTNIDTYIFSSLFYDENAKTSEFKMNTDYESLSSDGWNYSQQLIEYMNSRYNINNWPDIPKTDNDFFHIQWNKKPKTQEGFTDKTIINFIPNDSKYNTQYIFKNNDLLCIFNGNNTCIYVHKFLNNNLSSSQSIFIEYSAWTIGNKLLFLLYTSTGYIYPLFVSSFKKNVNGENINGTKLEPIKSPTEGQYTKCIFQPFQRNLKKYINGFYNSVNDITLNSEILNHENINDQIIHYTYSYTDNDSNNYSYQINTTKSCNIHDTNNRIWRNIKDKYHYSEKRISTLNAYVNRSVNSSYLKLSNIITSITIDIQLNTWLIISFPLIVRDYDKNTLWFDIIQSLFTTDITSTKKISSIQISNNVGNIEVKVDSNSELIIPDNNNFKYDPRSCIDIYIKTTDQSTDTVPVTLIGYVIHEIEFTYAIQKNYICNPYLETFDLIDSIRNDEPNLFENKKQYIDNINYVFYNFNGVFGTMNPYNLFVSFIIKTGYGLYIDASINIVSRVIFTSIIEIELFDPQIIYNVTGNDNDYELNSISCILDQQTKLCELLINKEGIDINNENDNNYISPDKETIIDETYGLIKFEPNDNYFNTNSIKYILNQIHEYLVITGNSFVKNEGIYNTYETIFPLTTFNKNNNDIESDVIKKSYIYDGDDNTNNPIYKSLFETSIFRINNENLNFLVIDVFEDNIPEIILDHFCVLEIHTLIWYDNETKKTKYIRNTIDETYVVYRISGILDVDGESSYSTIIEVYVDDTNNIEFKAKKRDRLSFIGNAFDFMIIL